ncbi:MAG: hypothetical protein V5A33_05935 [Halobacteriales archaeon]
MNRGLDRDAAVRIAGSVAASTLVITACFVGVAAVVTGFVTQFEQRLPVYVLLTAAVFVVIVVAFDSEDAPGRPVLASTVSLALVTFVVVTLAGEGLRYALTRPDEIVGSRLGIYFLSAGLVATGIGYWAVNHWREFTTP